MKTPPRASEKAQGKETRDGGIGRKGGTARGDAGQARDGGESAEQRAMRINIRKSKKELDKYMKERYV